MKGIVCLAGVLLCFPTACLARASPFPSTFVATKERFPSLDSAKAAFVPGPGGPVLVYGWQGVAHLTPLVSPDRLHVAYDLNEDDRPECLKGGCGLPAWLLVADLTGATLVSTPRILAGGATCHLFESISWVNDQQIQVTCAADPGSPRPVGVVALPGANTPHLAKGFTKTLSVTWSPDKLHFANVGGDRNDPDTDHRVFVDASGGPSYANDSDVHHASDIAWSPDSLHLAWLDGRRSCARDNDAYCALSDDGVFLAIYAVSGAMRILGVDASCLDISTLHAAPKWLDANHISFACGDTSQTVDLEDSRFVDWRPKPGTRPNFAGVADDVPACTPRSDDVPEQKKLVVYPRAGISDDGWHVLVQETPNSKAMSVLDDGRHKDQLIVSPDGKKFAFTSGWYQVNGARRDDGSRVVVADYTGKLLLNTDKIVGPNAEGLGDTCDAGIEWIDNDRLGVICDLGPNNALYSVLPLRVGHANLSLPPGLDFTWSPDRLHVAQTGTTVHSSSVLGQNNCVLIDGTTASYPGCSESNEGPDTADTALIRNIHSVSKLTWSPDSRFLAFYDGVVDWKLDLQDPKSADLGRGHFVNSRPYLAVAQPGSFAKALPIGACDEECPITWTDDGKVFSACPQTAKVFDPMSPKAKGLP